MFGSLAAAGLFAREAAEKHADTTIARSPSRALAVLSAMAELRVKEENFFVLGRDKQKKINEAESKKQHKETRETN